MMAKRPMRGRPTVRMADVDLEDDASAGEDDGRRRVRWKVWGTAAVLAVAATAVALASRGPDAPPVPLAGRVGPLEPGRYVLPIEGGEPHPLLPVISVPSGFTSFQGVGVLSGEADLESRMVWAWDISGVWSHPCDAGKVVEIVGPTVKDLADALAAQPLRDGTEPVPVSIGEHDGLYVELSVPEGTRVDSCAGGRFDSWVEGGTGGGRWQQGPGQVDMLWVLDVDGDRVTLAAAHGPNASPQAVDDIRSMITTATFAAADQS
jgi:hypothetical protein